MAETARPSRETETSRPDKNRLLAEALAEIARAISKSLDLKQVFSAVADGARRVLQFDGMGVNVLDGPDKPSLMQELESGDATYHNYAVAGSSPSPQLVGPQLRIGDASWALRGKIAERTRYHRVPEDLDPSFKIDKLVIETGSRSLLFGALHAGDRLLGGVWFSSYTENAYSADDAAIVGPIADLIALALQHERLFEIERKRRERTDALQALLPALSKALDVREVIDQLSAAAETILPHDRMVVGLFDQEKKKFRIHAISGGNLPELPEAFEIAPEEPRNATENIGDVQAMGLPPERLAFLGKLGVQSLLRVPLRPGGEIVGALGFLSKQRDFFRPWDAEIAHRIADQVALVIAHEILAKEARRAEEARAEAAQLESRVAVLTEQLESLGAGHRVLGRSKSWRGVLDLVSKVAPTDTTVLLTGESGTGKEVVARAIHAASRRSGKPFLAINCAALPEQLLESELFGYERGAFTGALQSRAGKIEQAAGGVLFLDEVGEMAPHVQAKFLRVLQEREFQRLGGSRVQKCDVRVVAATNRNLADAIARGAFREDLYYRLGVFEIALPPLRDRSEDIPLLAQSFVDEISRHVGPCGGISDEAREALVAYRWPGNVRELRNAIERAIILCGGGLITAAHLPIAAAPVAPATASARDGVTDGPLPDVERRLVEKALRETKNNKAQAARLLGITRAQLYTRLQKYGLAVVSAVASVL
jgi:transcriptional regulator with GAF, ATPase, and Fis domain